MRVKIIKLIVIILNIYVFIPPVMAADRLPVFVSIVPQKYFVQQIGKDLVDVRVMVQPGASPATYEPKPRQMGAISGTRVYFAIGVPFERAWLKKISAANGDMVVVHTDRGIEKIPMASQHPLDEKAGHDETAGGHQDAHQHEDGSPDPHIWLSPRLVKIQAVTILEALKAIDPSHGADYQSNFDRFAAAIDELDAHLKKVFAGRQGLRFMVFHPSWGYFARAYGIEPLAVELEGKEPKAAQLKGLIEHARDEGIQALFVQPQFSTKSARLIAREIGGQVVVADPLAEDWMANLREVADRFKAALK